MPREKSGTPTFLDTHAWVWWVTEDDRLARKTRTWMDSTASEMGLWISAISIWEVAKKVEKNRLILDRSLNEWLDLAVRKPSLYVAELTPSILAESCQLPKPFYGDPADQMIVATVRHHQGRLVTQDKKLSQYPHVVTVW